MLSDPFVLLSDAIALAFSGRMQSTKGNIMFDHTFTAHDLANMTRGQVEYHYQNGAVTQLEFEAYMLAWETARPGTTNEERYVIERGYREEVFPIAEELRKAHRPRKRATFRY